VTSSSDRLKIGFVGCGRVAKHYSRVLEPLVRASIVEVTFACDTVAAKHDSALSETGAARFTVNFREVVHSSDVDLVLVLTPMAEHAAIAAEALRGGKHVMVEKPLAVTIEEGVQLVELARRNSQSLVCAPLVTLSPTHRAMARLLHDRSIGLVTAARARCGSGGPTWGAWYYGRNGGVLFDLGVYNITSLTALLGPAVRVTAMARTALPKRIVDGREVNVESEDTAQLLLEFREGAIATVTTGFSLHRYRGAAIEIYGDHGTLNLLGDDWAPSGHELWTEAQGWTTYPATHAWQWADGIRPVVEWIRHGVRTFVQAEHALHVLEIMCQAKASGDDGQTRTLQTTFDSDALDELLATDESRG
jgi:predicted dehydrogenase